MNLTRFFLVVIITFFAFGADLSQNTTSTSSDVEGSISKSSEILPANLDTFYAKQETTVVLWRAALATAFSLSALTYASITFNDNWGQSTGSSWHWKTDDWNGDNLAQNDEISHFIAGQRVVQLGQSVAQWAGFRKKQAELFGVISSSIIVVWIEVKDAYNPAQGFGPIDLVFGMGGVGFEMLRTRGLEKWDVRASFKSFKSLPPTLIVAEEGSDYDNAIYWLTYQPSEKFPVDLCFGYSTYHENFEVGRELYAGVGISGANLGALFGKIPGKLGSLACWYEITIGVELYRGK